MHWYASWILGNISRISLDKGGHSHVMLLQVHLKEYIATCSRSSNCFSNHWCNWDIWTSMIWRSIYAGLMEVLFVPYMLSQFTCMLTIFTPWRFLWSTARVLITWVVLSAFGECLWFKFWSYTTIPAFFQAFHNLQWRAISSRVIGVRSWVSCRRSLRLLKNPNVNDFKWLHW